MKKKRKEQQRKLSLNDHSRTAIEISSNSIVNLRRWWIEEKNFLSSPVFLVKNKYPKALYNIKASESLLHLHILFFLFSFFFYLNAVNIRRPHLSNYWL